MIQDLAEVLVRVTGGFWATKRRIEGLPRGVRRKLLMELYYLYLRNYNSYIGHNAVFADEPCFPHGLHGVFIAGGARIGRNCVIFQHVTIGTNPLPDSRVRGKPTIGDECYIGAGATIVGGVKIGNRCRIGANSTVFRDVEDDSTVLPPEPRVLSGRNNLNRYYVWSRSGPVYYRDGAWVPEDDPEVLERLNGCL